MWAMRQLVLLALLGAGCDFTVEAIGPTPASSSSPSDPSSAGNTGTTSNPPSSNPPASNPPAPNPPTADDGGAPAPDLAAAPDLSHHHHGGEGPGPGPEG
jgi:hypothetical protein